MIRQFSLGAAICAMLGATAASTAAAGQAPLNGAFGLRLGAPFDPAIVVSAETDTLHYEYFLVEPPRLSFRLQHYGVYVTPHSRVIYRLVGWGRYADRSACREAAREVNEALFVYLGAPDPSPALEDGTALFTSGDCWVSIACVDSGRMIDLRVTYFDAAVAAEALP